VDATQSQIDYAWWFRKPVGMGATIQDLKIDIEPKRRITLTGAATLDTSPLNATFTFSRESGKWQMQRVDATSDGIDVVTTGKCLRLPYTASGGLGTACYYAWERMPGGPKSSLTRAGARFDGIALHPENSDIPFDCKGVQLEMTMDNSREPRTGTLSLSASEGKVPPLGSPWFLPMRPADPELAEKYPVIPRDWSYTLSAEVLHMPPWHGQDFEGTVYSDPRQTGLSHFGADIDGGRLDGSYRLEKGDNISELVAQWTDLPATYLIRHLNFPELLTGTMNGEVRYTVDRDDPGTLRGTGFFDIRDGQFSADFLRRQFEGQLDGSITSLPSSLRFPRLRADVEFEGDTVKTRNMQLDAEGIEVSGDGQFIIDGDMDYDLRVSIAPDTAKRIPILVESFNLEGHRLTQNDIELAFHITGPTFNPTGEVAGMPPIGVTLVSGAAEVTSRAIKVIDLPRQILVDLVKIGGGIVGPGR